MIARRLEIRGLVQGVFFRDWTVQTARDLGLTGWVRNRADGSVEVLAIGAVDAVERFVSACHRGSPSARVDGVDVSEAAVELLTGFERRGACSLPTRTVLRRMPERWRE